MDHLKSKIGILIIILVVGGASCNQGKLPERNTVVRFDKLLFSTSPASVPDSIRNHHPALLPFFRIYNEEVIRIGPDTLPDYASLLSTFTGDALINEIHAETEKSAAVFNEYYTGIQQALDKWAEITNSPRVDYLVPFISGFNQSFIALPGLLGIGIDQYLGADNKFYQDLGIPAYIRKNKNPENLVADAVRAWLYSEIPAPEGGFLERMIYEGKIYFIASKLLPKTSQENLFHYSETQLEWCREQESAMWKYLAEQKILFSTDRLTTRKFMDEAPFTRDFGNDSPGRVGTWIGYRIVSSYMKTSGLELKSLPGITSAKEILSGSKYHP